MSATEYVFGANTIENLTTGMYQDSRIIYREYIQNACDQIDKAKAVGILAENEGLVKIWIEPKERRIEIEDNATGIPSASFVKTLGDVANSSKKIGEDKGFRGIGKLAGLAYCKKLVFTSSAKGENIISTMECDAALMRELIDEHNQGKKHTAIEILQNTYKFSTQPTDDTDSHFFRVEIIDVNEENKDLLQVEEIRGYLSFVAPVPYSSKFYIKEKIYKYAKDHAHKIDEYNITINGQSLFKEYELNYKTRSGDDAIRDIVFHEFKDNNNVDLGWMWLGVSGFKGSIPESCKMRCLRLRKENIQIGGENALQRFFTEDRGVKYFIGEIFVTSPMLIPNSQRDYFNENEARISFEQVIRRYVNGELNKIYHKGSEMNTHLSNLRKFDKEVADFEEKKRNNDFLNPSYEKKAKEHMEAVRSKAEAAKKFFQKVQEKENEGIAEGIIAGVASKRMDEYKKERRAEKKKEAEQNTTSAPKAKSQTTKTSRRTDKFVSYSKKERKLIERIYIAIDKAVDKKIAEQIYQAIEENLL